MILQFLSALVVASTLGLSNIKEDIKPSYKSDDISFHLDYTKNAVYDDEEYTITLSVNELNDYLWNNLVTLLNSYNSGQLASTSMDYSPLSYDLGEISIDDSLIYEYNDMAIYLSLANDTDYKWEYFTDYSTDAHEPFSNEVVWNLNSVCYLEVKSAIELDIQANSGVNPNTDIIYNDNAMTISLPSSYVNGTKFRYFYDYISQDDRYEEVSFVFNTEEFNYEDNSNGCFQYGESYSTSIEFVFDSVLYEEELHISDLEDYHIYYSHVALNSYLVFDVSALGVSNYYAIKNAIQEDINHANLPQNEDVLTAMVTTLVGGIVPFATGLGSGVSTLVSDIFVNNGALSVFASIVIIFCSIALAIGLSRWVMKFLTSLGAKK